MQNTALKKFRDYSLTISESAINLVVNLVILIMVARFLGEEALGTFSYLLSLYFIFSFISDLGISGYVEKEIALHIGDRHKQEMILAGAVRAMRWSSILFATIFLFSSYYDATHTSISEKMAAYIIIGIIIPFRNFNGIKLALFQATGMHDVASKLLIKKRAAMVVILFFMLCIKIPPSYLLIGILISEIYFMIAARQEVGSPNLDTVGYVPESVMSVLEKSVRFLFTDETLDIVLYLDFLILGLFVSSYDLGVYAEAAILARIFLLIPISIKPIFRKNYCDAVSQGNITMVSNSMRKTAVLIFFLHSILGLYILLHFSDIIHWLFKTWGVELVSFRIFTVLMPGLLMFSAVIVQEPIYEAIDRVHLLQKLIIKVAIVNLAANFYLVPFSGIYGAATATAIAMFVYFILFALRLEKTFKTNKFLFLVAGAVVYLVYMFFQTFELYFLITSWLIPIVIFVFFYLIDFFNFNEKHFCK